jgi:lysozyme
VELSDTGRKLLRELEGCSAVPYRDSAGLWTIGIGHLLTKSELSSGKITTKGGYFTYKNGPISESTIGALLTQDTQIAARTIRETVHVTLWQHQFDGLVCFCFNIGSTAFTRSTLRRLLNAGEYSEIPTQMRRWVYSGGEVIQGLKNRREKEIALWEGRYK